MAERAVDSAAPTTQPTTARELWARRIYTWALQGLQPAYRLRLWLRGRAEPLYRHALAERFGVYTQTSGSGWVWVHAVSLGETLAAQALVDALRMRQPGMRLLLTHGTATGMEAGRALLHAGDRQTWLPYDTPAATQRFFKHFNPVMGVLMETEIWPNLLHAAQAHGVPMVLANARLSAKSFKQGQRYAALFKPAAQSLSLVLAQTENDAKRIRKSGAARKVVQITGNLKFDLTPNTEQLLQGAAWRQLLRRQVVMAAITREGEEAMLLDAWMHGKQRAPDALLLIVPRHPQRFDEVATLVRARGLTLARRSTWQDTPHTEALKAQVWLGDSMREMPVYYAAAHVALLGGSFAPLGGHNLIEAAACGCPLVMGPSTFNFHEAARLSLAAGACVRAADMVAAVAEANKLLRDRNRLTTLSANAVRFAEQHRGAAQRMARQIEAMVFARD
jgi:3-deoxy-D-manno-octulosonic-acid transferase